jgi:hypothetical protein
MYLTALPKSMTTIAYAEVIPEWAFEPLQTKGVGYIDLAGELYLPIRLSQRRKSSQPSDTDVAPKGAARGQREQLLFALLSEPSLRHKSQRTIAKEIQMAHSTVSHGLAALVSDGDIIVSNRNHEIRINQAPHMLDRWLEFFSTNFKELTKPEIFRSSLQKLDPSWWQSTAISDLYWSGDVAASRLGGNLRPERYLIYHAGQARQDVMRSLRLVPDPRGTIEMRRRFWKFSWPDEQVGLVPLPLIYSDLMLTGDSRAAAAANAIQIRIVDAAAN